MTPAIDAYLILAALFIIAVLTLIHVGIKRFLPAGCAVLVIGFILVAFVYTLNH